MAGEIKSLGTDSGKGNIVGVQPFMEPEDYITGENFFQALEKYLYEAKKMGFIGDKTVMVFPEYTGTWLVFTDLGLALDKYNSVFEMIKEINGNQNADLAAVFRSRSAAMTGIYQKVFSGLAQKYRVGVVAGSILLAEPKVVKGKLETRAGPIFNVSAVFLPDGSIYPRLIKKIHLVPLEKTFVTPGEIRDFQTVETVIGKIGVLVCADSWYPEVYKKLDEDGVEYIVVPSYQNENGLWNKPWRGYSAGEPKDFDREDIGKITEGQAWKKYALAGRLKETRARGGINVFLKGNLWDMGADSGHSLAILGEEEAELTTSRDGLVNMWLGLTAK